MNPAEFPEAQTIFKPPGGVDESALLIAFLAA